MQDIFWDALSTEYGDNIVAEIKAEATDYVHFLLSRTLWWADISQLVSSEGGVDAMIRDAACNALIADTPREGLVDWSKRLVKEYRRPDRRSKGYSECISLEAYTDRLQKSSKEELDIPLVVPFEAPSLEAPFGGAPSSDPLQGENVLRQLTSREAEIVEVVASVVDRNVAGELLGTTGHNVRQTLRRIRQRLPKQGDLSYDEYRSLIASKAACAR